jgi:hypothetical protein
MRHAATLRRVLFLSLLVLLGIGHDGFCVGMAWLLQAVQPQGVAGPQQPTFAPVPALESTPLPLTEPTAESTGPMPTPTPPSQAAGTIIYRAGPRGEERLYQLAVNGQGQPIDLPAEIPGSLSLDGPFHLSPDEKYLAINYWAEQGAYIYILNIENSQITPLIRDKAGEGGKL